MIEVFVLPSALLTSLCSLISRLISQFDQSFHVSGASPRIWACGTRPFSLRELGGVWPQDYSIHS